MMMRNPRTNSFSSFNSVTLVGLAALLGSCESPESEPTVDLGAEVSLGDGSVQSFHVHDESGSVAIGVRLSAAALQNLPTEDSDGRYDVLDGEDIVLACCGHEIIIPLPSGVADETPFQSIVLNYNPHGHGPPDVYDREHIDFHFYTIGESERMGILGTQDAAEMCLDISLVDSSFPPIPVPMTCEQVELTTQPLPEDQQPPGYVSVGAVEPAMGNHLIDPTAPEFNGTAFSDTFIYGSHAGELVFLEPMVTLEKLLGLSGRECHDIAMPESFPDAGSYPTQYCIEYLAAEEVYEVSMEGFVDYPASGG